MIARQRLEQPGIHRGVEAATYLGLNACSSGRLRDMGRSPAYCRYRMDHPRPASAAMMVGSLVDALLLDPEAVDTFTVKDWDARTREGKARRDEVDAEGLQVLSQADYDRALCIFHQLQASPWWSGLSDVWTQTSATWVDSDHDILCRLRADILADGGILADLKVCREAVPSTYLRSCVGLFHPQQLAWYARGLDACGHRVRERWILAVHPEPPHETTAYRMTPDLNAWADRVVGERLERYAECLASGSWPGPGDEMDVPLPEWARTADKPEIDFSELDVEEENDA